MTAQRGFTLIEMAIVLIIVTLLIGGLTVPLAAQIQARRVVETNKTLDEAREAIMGYAMSHTNTCSCEYNADGDGTHDWTDCPATISCPVIDSATAPRKLPLTRHWLPCPDTDNDGKENRGRPGEPNACTETVGLFPWVTLSTAKQDAWGNHVGYSVSDTFADSSKGITYAAVGDLQVCGASGCAMVDVADQVPAVIVSFGPNGWGARNVNGSQLADPTSDDEKENTNGDSKFVSRSPSKAGDISGEFDDLVEWISADQLRGRICPAGGCP
jgi:prepilin-type N-terminal cleavage/methylation domain-containing protein